MRRHSPVNARCALRTAASTSSAVARATLANDSPVAGSMSVVDIVRSFVQISCQ
jgi:hypothetical protein